MSTWYEKSVFYHIYPLGLTGASKHNTGERSGGGFAQLDEWLPHIQSLGCTALYIGPLFESSSHGYDTIDYKKADSRLGTNEELKEFVAQSHKAGIKVVVDGVFNHTGREFFAFRDIQEKGQASPYKDWYKGINFGWQSPMGDSFGYEAWQGHYELPCLNLPNPQVRQYLFDTIQFWVNEFDIDGIRLDCANVLDFTFMQELRTAVSRMKEDFWLMGEVIHGDYGRWVNDQMLHSVTNYELHKSIYSGHNDHNYFEIAHNVRRLEALSSKLYTFLDNHDEDRIASKLNVKEHLFPAHVLLYTLPGIPSIYYGGEWGIEGRRTSDSDDALRPCLSLNEEEARQKPLEEFITKLAHIHTQRPEFHGGRYQELLLTNRQYAFARFADHSVSITAVNNDEQEAVLDIPIPVNASSAVNLMDDTVIPVSDKKIKIQIPGNWGIVLKLMED